MNCIVVDDEMGARSVLKEYIEETDDLMLIAEFKNPLAAIDHMNKYSVDLVFLDINMPDLSGMKVPELLKNDPLIIYTTAYNEYAVKSYELNAVDYLLKPIPYKRFVEAVSKAREKLRSFGNEKDSPALFVKSGNEFYRMELKDIQFIEKDGHYATFYTKSKKILSRFTIKKALDDLPGSDFIQIHKSYIISLNHIDSFDGNIVKIDGHNLPLGHTFKKAFFHRLSSQKTIGL